MKIFKDSIDRYKNKKDLSKKLKFYKEFVLKKLEIDDLNSSLEKARSAITLIKDYQENFDLEKELKEFSELNQEITSELNNHRNIYVRRLNNLLKENADESNLENLMKLMVILKSDADQIVDKYNLYDVQSSINRYFGFIKRLYIVLSSYEIVNYFDVAENIFQFMKDLEFENFPNLEVIIQSIYQKLVTRRLFELAKQYDKLFVSNLTDKMAMNQEDLMDFIITILEQPNSPIKVYDSTNQEITFNRENSKTE